MFSTFGRAYPVHEIDRPRTHKPIIIISAGHIVCPRGDQMKTLRTQGRRDYQLLYVHSGCGHFFWDDKDCLVPSGRIVLYRPGEYQHYEYRIEDASEVYWIHFTGSGVEKELSDMGLKDSGTFAVNGNDEYVRIFDSIIQELQFKELHFDDMVASYFKELLCLFSRKLLERTPVYFPRTKEVEDAVSFFNTHFNQRLSLSEYAAQQNMSLCWFTRIFRRQMGVSPQRYLMEIRMNNACELLGSGIDIAEASDMVGYEDACYFSRIFKKYTGYSPREYQKRLDYPLHSTT